MPFVHLLNPLYLFWGQGLLEPISAINGWEEGRLWMLRQSINRPHRDRQWLTSTFTNLAWLWLKKIKPMNNVFGLWKETESPHVHKEAMQTLIRRESCWNLNQEHLTERWKCSLLHHRAARTLQPLLHAQRGSHPQTTQYTLKACKHG